MKIITVEFKNDIIEVVDNFVSVKKLCENLGIDKTNQYKKIQQDESFESEFKEIEINGIIQRVLCIPIEKINGWLFSINQNRVKPDVKQKLIEYKNECFDVLYNHFNNKSNYSEIPNSSVKELQEVILKQNALIAATTKNISIEQSKHKNLAKLYEKTLNENETLKQKMTQQLSLIVSQVGKEILTRFEESLDVTSRSLELQKLKK